MCTHLLSLTLWAPFLRNLLSHILTRVCSRVSRVSRMIPVIRNFYFLPAPLKLHDRKGTKFRIDSPHKENKNHEMAIAEQNQGMTLIFGQFLIP